MLNISHLSRAEVLDKLYNASQPLGMGFLHYTPELMSVTEAQTLLDQLKNEAYFDYLKGRVMKINLNDPCRLDPRLYDRDNGEGAAARALGIVP